MSYYTKFTPNMFGTPLIVYTIANILTILIYLMDFKFKGEKGIFNYIKKYLDLMPLIIVFIMIWFTLNQIKRKSLYYYSIAVLGFARIQKLKFVFATTKIISLIDLNKFITHRGEMAFSIKMLPWTIISAMKN